MALSMAYSSRTFIVFWILSPEPEAAAIAASMFPAERYTIDSTAKIWMAISASFSFINPKSPICFPNALRSFAYFEEAISTCFEPPTQEAPSVNRPAFRMLNATMCPRPRVVRARSVLRLVKAVRADPFASRELRQILFLLRFRAKVNDRQGADAGVRPVRYRKAAVDRKFFRKDRGGNFVQACAAEFFRYASAHQADFAALFHQLRHQPGLLILQILDEWEDFFEDKFFRRLPDQFLVVGQISRREYIARLRRFQEKASSLCCRLGESSGGHVGRS